MKRGIAPLVALLVAISIIVEIVLSVGVIAKEGADGDGNAWGGVANNGGLFISTDSATWKAPSLDDIAAGKVNHVRMNEDGSITIDGFNGTGGFHASGATIRCPEGTTNLYMYSMTAQRSDYGYEEGDLVGLMGMDGNSQVYNSSELGGGTTYNPNVSGGLSFGEVESAYNDLYNQGLVHVGWSNGNGLSWFCSNGDGLGGNIDNTTCRNAASDATYMSTKVMDFRLSHKSWVNEIYAMPTDQVRWNNCYGAGVQNRYGNRRDWFSEISYTSPGAYWKSDDPEPDYPVAVHHNHITTWIDERNITEYFAEDRWQNFFTLERGGYEPLPSSYGKCSGSGCYQSDFINGGEFNLGKAVKVQRVDDYYINQTSDVGTSKYDTSNTGEPTRFSISGSYHTWCSGPCEWQEDVYGPNWDECGSHVVVPAGTYIEDGDYYTDVDYEEANSCWYKVDKSDYNRHNSAHNGGNWKSTDFVSDPVGETATVYVPYNFVNTAILEIADKKNGDLVYSGDQIQITKAAVKVNPVGNQATEATYATIVRNPKAAFIAYATPNPSNGINGWANSSDPCGGVEASVISGRRLCKSLSYNASDFNSNGDLNGVEEPLSDISGKSQMVFDANAGDYMCYAVAVYPSGSGDPTNWQDPEGTHQWAYSDPMCLKIAKKPFFGVYGGSLYSADKVITANMGKTNIFGDSELDFEKVWENGIRGKKYFGSFVEQSVFGIYSISGLASGSAYKENIGVNEVKYCERMVPLTMANASKNSGGACMDGETSGLMGESGRLGVVDREIYIDFWLRNSLRTGNTDRDSWGSYEILYSNTGKNVYYTEINGDASLGGMNIPNGTTRLVKVSGALNITGDIKYSESGRGISSAGDIPQAVIYADSITINCRGNAVKEVDAILIAKELVSTCDLESSNYSGYANGIPISNNPNASNPLTVRGMIITDHLKLSRTYGAAVDGKSGTPAETINYDTSTILWARYMAGAAESNTLTEVYRTELAPRY